MGTSKSSQTTRNIVIAFLALWSIVSLIVIVVWATSPDMKGASQCRAELRVLQEKFDREKAVWTDDRQALEHMVRQSWLNQSLLLNLTAQLKDTINILNESLDMRLKQNAMLHENITWLKSEVELHEAIEANLTANISKQKDLIEDLQLNLTQAQSTLESCTVQNQAAQLLQKAAEKERDTCKTRIQYMEKQLTKCQNTVKAEQVPHTGAGNDGPPGPRGLTAVVVILCTSLFLIS
ncbi:outer dynein arm-docking complex subunit 1 isoform X1 [Hoplias malabaricus]|uniref:outer dynein arm-docking complex subunit 1 isoform X1 n=1 Tax=Hoplias malabaricus TaxID=27720 RepID=UPI00346279A5